jgi:hypothetical protein
MGSFCKVLRHAHAIGAELIVAKGLTDFKAAVLVEPAGRGKDLL